MAFFVRHLGKRGALPIQEAERLVNRTVEAADRA